MLRICQGGWGSAPCVLDRTGFFFFGIEWALNHRRWGYNGDMTKDLVAAFHVSTFSIAEIIILLGQDGSHHGSEIPPRIPIVFQLEAGSFRGHSRSRLHRKVESSGWYFSQVSCRLPYIFHPNTNRWLHVSDVFPIFPIFLNQLGLCYDR